jgi:sugar lactone lactonase YvrE
METDVELVLDARAELAESPVWHQGALTWCDIERGTLHRWSERGERQTWDLGQKTSAVAPADDGRWIAAGQHGLALVDLASGRRELIADPEADRPENRFNDGKCDPAGRFWAGTINRDRAPLAALYRLDADLTCRRILDGVINSNGLAWSEDRRTMYYIDTGTRRVDAFDYELATGGISSRRTVIDLAGEGASPDGMTIDRQGRLWVALWRGGAVVRIDPLRRAVTDRIRLPVTRVSSCCFGGAQLDELFITTARSGLAPDELARQPHAGGIFRARPGVAGFPTSVFKRFA